MKDCPGAVSSTSAYSGQGGLRLDGRTALRFSTGGSLASGWTLAMWVRWGGSCPLNGPQAGDVCTSFAFDFRMTSDSRRGYSLWNDFDRSVGDVQLRMATFSPQHTPGSAWTTLRRGEWEHWAWVSESSDSRTTFYRDGVSVYNYTSSIEASDFAIVGTRWQV